MIRTGMRGIIELIRKHPKIRRILRCESPYFHHWTSDVGQASPGFQDKSRNSWLAIYVRSTPIPDSVKVADGIEENAGNVQEPDSVVVWYQNLHRFSICIHCVPEK